MSLRAVLDKKVILATHNRSKITEIATVLEPLGYEILTASDFSLPEPAETGRTLLENARIKAHLAAAATGIPVVADDSGFEVDAIGGEPGVYTADWASDAQSGRDDMLAMKRIRDAALVVGHDLESSPSPARFRCTLVMAWPDGREAVFTGVCEGSAVWPPRGASGFGQDQMFVPEGHRRTFGEMEASEKVEISHRTAALKSMLDAFEQDEVMDFPWKRLSMRSGNMLEWADGPYTDKYHTLRFEPGAPMKIDGRPSGLPQHQVNAEDLSEILHFCAMDDSGETRTRLDGSALLISIDPEFEHDDVVRKEGAAAVLDRILSEKWQTPSGSDSFESIWKARISGETIEP